MILGVTDCIEKYAMARGITKTQAEIEFKTALEVIADACVEGGVAFRGLFTIKQKTLKGRESKMNGVSYFTEDKKALKIKVGSDLEARLNK